MNFNTMNPGLWEVEFECGKRDTITNGHEEAKGEVDKEPRAIRGLNKSRGGKSPSPFDHGDIPGVVEGGGAMGVIFEHTIPFFVLIWDQ